ncbi:hypothetical protein Efla_007314 [Eimeria flavescens]
MKRQSQNMPLAPHRLIGVQKALEVTFRLPPVPFRCSVNQPPAPNTPLGLSWAKHHLSEHFAGILVLVTHLDLAFYAN